MNRPNNPFFDDFGDQQSSNGASSSPSLSDQIDLQQYLRILRKHKWPIVLLTALVTTLAAYYAHTATPIYSATSTLLIESQKTDVISVNELVGLDNENSDYYQTQFELLKSRELALRVVRHLGLLNNPYYSPLPTIALERSAAGINPDLYSGSSSSGLSQNDTSNPQTGLAETADQLTGDSTETGFSLDRISLDRIKSAVSELFAQLTSDRDAQENSTGSANDSVAILNTETGALDEAGAVPGNQVVSNYPELDLSLFTQEEIESAERAAVGTFLGGLSINPVRRTKLVKISYLSPDPAFAANAANAVGEQYIVAYLDARLELTTQASTWLSGKLQDLKKKLEGSEAKLLTFKEQNNLVDVDGSVGRLNERELFYATEELARARSELSDAADLRSQVRRFRGDTQLLESLPIFQTDPVVREMKIETGQLQRELDELLNRYGERHPRIIDARSRLQSIQNTLNANVARIVETVENEHRLISQRVASLEASLSEGKREIQGLGSKQFELESLEREVQTNRDLYDTFFTRMTEADSAEGLEAANARVTEYAIASGRPIKPKKSLIIALAALGSLILSMLMAFLYEQMDDTVKSAEDVERKIGVRMLGILPLIKGGLLGGKKELPLNPLEIKDKKGTFMESINTARTAITLDDNGKHRRVILVTSSVPGEGKSTTSLNLAFALAQMEKTLLIDCDLRRPTIAKSVNLPRTHPGLSSIIAGTAPARECILRGAIGDLDIMCSGPAPDQPLELLSSARFANILEQLGQHYDRIVLDCAPTQAVSDALVLSQLSDAVVYNVKSHDTSVELVKRGLTRLRQVNAKIAGVLITQVDIDKIVSYGGDYYYQGYYDYYGYNTRGEKNQDKLELSREEMARINSEDDRIEYDFGLPTNGADEPALSVGNGVHIDSALPTNGYESDPFAETYTAKPNEHNYNDGDKDSLGSSATSRRGQVGRFADDLDLL